MSGHDNLAAALLRAVHRQDFASTDDRWQPGRPLGLMPSIDLALVVFAPGHAPRWANVLFSREHAAGVVARIAVDAGPVRNIRFDADQRDEHLESPLWAPGADWSRRDFAPLWGPLEPPGLRFVAPYPASLLKLMVAVGVGLAVDAGRCAWPDVQDTLEPMITVSSNEATDECVALLHRTGMVDALNARLQALALPTLRLLHTTPAGGWRNADGAGVGRIHMTAWDTVRLLWLLDADAPPAPWLPPGTTLLRPATREHLRGVLQRQQRDEILSSGALRGVPGWVRGGPDAPAFAHKTGTTDNYASDAGIVRTGGLHYLVAVLTTLGRRFAPHARCATTWRLPALGAEIERIARGTT
jgi:hypothetical protein